jgi:hypothetical protein
MDIERLIEGLGYANDPGLLDLAKAELPTNLAHHFRRAQDTCGLKAVYALRGPNNASTIPLVYLSEAKSEDQAKEIHRRVWNQNLVPFLIISTPDRYVLYPGFRFKRDSEKQELDWIIKETRLSLNTFRKKFEGLDAESIATGTIWQYRRQDINLESRVDWTLLEELEALGKILMNPPYSLPRHQAHALIGKFVYLNYLRDRNILSDELLADWNISANAVFGRDATLPGFLSINERMDAWLNGSVFPLADDGRINEAAIRYTASILAGDKTSGQTALPFKVYDFSHIPIETLSVIYQQFLHAEDKGRVKGAYYTPVHLVDLILDEATTRCPLLPGTTVLDPACGSGAFLVQAYRRLIEQLFGTGAPLKPGDLSNLLTQHIFGIDQDEDACRVACLSLILTLLDYVDPPDLLRYPDFRLPALYGSNIVKGDFFDSGLPWRDQRFDCIVGNPPWLEVNSNKPEPGHEAAIAWMKTHSHDYPVGGYQIAEAFAWKTGEHLAREGVAALLMPAMTLFKTHSKDFRKGFFSQFSVWCVANFANLAYILFGRRSEVPAAAIFFQHLQENGKEEDILSYAPFVANQPALHSKRRKGFKEAWVLTANGGEMRWVDRAEACRGEGLTWKIAMWGSFRDRRLLERVGQRFSSLATFLSSTGLKMHEGRALQEATAQNSEFVQELVGQRRLNTDKLPNKCRLFGFPESSLEPIGLESAYLEKGRVDSTLSVCRPPHIIIGESREWVVFNDNFLLVPPRKLAIAGAPGQDNLLKALSVYLISDFAGYFFLFHSPQYGIQKSIIQKFAFNSLPVPFEASSAIIEDLAKLYDALTECWQHWWQEPLGQHKTKLRNLEREANQKIFQALGLRETERWLVEDLIHARLELIKGKSGDSVVQQPKQNELQAYGEALAHTLDGFLNRGGERSHRVEILAGQTDGFGVAAVMLSKGNSDQAIVTVNRASTEVRRELENIRHILRRNHNHWLYFERSLTIFDNDRILLIKPMQRLHWLRSQALQDADNLISDILSGGKSIS